MDESTISPDSPLRVQTDGPAPDGPDTGQGTKPWTNERWCSSA